LFGGSVVSKKVVCLALFRDTGGPELSSNGPSEELLPDGAGADADCSSEIKAGPELSSNGLSDCSSEGTEF
jgi:hypothetical protein